MRCLEGTFKMEMYSLSRIGKLAVKHGHTKDAEDYEILKFVSDHGEATMSELEVAGPKWRVNKLREDGFIKPLHEV